jgi:hypothetical protein
MIFITPAKVREEVERTDSLLRAAGQRGPIWFRPPYRLQARRPAEVSRGDRTDDGDVEHRAGFVPRRRGVVAGIVRHVLDRVQPGSIIILHPWYASRRTSREAIGPLVDSLHARGYRVETVGTLLGASSPTRGAVMAVSSGYQTFVLDQLRPTLPGVRAKRMFGGVGLYADELFFALIDDDVLYLKVDDETRPDFERRGSATVPAVRRGHRDDAVLPGSGGAARGSGSAAAVGRERRRRRASREAEKKPAKKRR